MLLLRNRGTLVLLRFVLIPILAASVGCGRLQFASSVSNTDGPTDNDRRDAAATFDSNQRSCVGGPTTLTINMQARRVIGQANFTENLPNRGGAATAATLNQPRGIQVFNGNIYIADTDNNRVLVFHGEPTTDGANADEVIGQATFTATSAGLGPNGLSAPQGIAITPDYLAIAEWGNARVGVRFTNAQPPIFLGQPDSASNTPNNGGVSAQSMGPSTGVATFGNKLLVADPGNNRILVYDTATWATHAAAIQVLGQPNFTSNALSAAVDGLDTPYGIFTDSRRVYISDAGNNRIVMYEGLPTPLRPEPLLVWGSFGQTATTLNNQVSGFADGNRLFVADRGNDRIMVFDAIPATSRDPASVVIGQPNFATGDHNQCSCEIAKPNSLWGANFVTWDGCRLYVSDTQNNRVLVY